MTQVGADIDSWAEGDFEVFRGLLEGREHKIIEGNRRAAVAAIFRTGKAGEVEILLIHRAEDVRDPRSGHMAFPGGRVDDDDASPEAAAIRETEEEVGLRLESHARLLGRLSDVTAVARGRRLGLVIEPFVFELVKASELRLNAEVQEALWVPLGFFFNEANRSSLTYDFEDRTYELPCYRYDGRVVWGLTLRMLDEVLEILSGRVIDDWPER